jgi:hypothetical protein
MAKKKISDTVREYLRQLGAKGGRAAAGRGAKVRFEAMTPQQRRALARKAAAARWGKHK